MEFDPNDSNEAQAPRPANAVIGFHVEIRSLADDAREEDGANLVFDGILNLAKVARSLNLHAMHIKGKSQKQAPMLESLDGRIRTLLLPSLIGTNPGYLHAMLQKSEARAWRATTKTTR